MAEAAEQAGQESMEEILQSIKRIMDDNTGAEQKPAAESDVYDLTNVVKDDVTMANTPPPTPPAAQPAPPQNIEKAIPEIAAAAPAPAPSAAEIPAAEDTEAGLLSKNAAFAAVSAFKQIADSSHKDFSIPNIPSPQFRSGKTIEDLVLEALRPMLKEWLDENLPLIVQKIVEKEVKRLIAFHYG